MTIASAPITVTADGRRTALGTPVPTPPPPLPGREATPLSVEAAEAEPNDTLPGANRARTGVAIDGTLAAGDRDWFSVDIPATRRGRLVATLVTTDASVTMTLFDDSGQPLGIARTIDEVSVQTASAGARSGAPPLLHPADAGSGLRRATSCCSRRVAGSAAPSYGLRLIASDTRVAWLLASAVAPVLPTSR